MICSEPNRVLTEIFGIGRRYLGLGVGRRYAVGITGTPLEAGELRSQRTQLE
jgi:hypothetical protein